MHSACLKTNPKCQYMKQGVTAVDITKILNVHNRVRNHVARGHEKRGKAKQPSATNMLEMFWDNELAQMAQNWADQCKIAHDCRKCRQVERFNTGQNLYMSKKTNLDTEPDWDAAIRSWYNEVTLFLPNMINPFRFEKTIGHYTQVVWAVTDKVGCGYSVYKDGKFTVKLYVCDYGPVGNTAKAAMYEAGDPCTNCPAGMGCSTDFVGLCAPGGKGAPPKGGEHD